MIPVGIASQNSFLGSPLSHPKPRGWIGRAVGRGYDDNGYSCYHDEEETHRNTLGAPGQRSPHLHVARSVVTGGATCDRGHTTQKEGDEII